MIRQKTPWIVIEKNLWSIQGSDQTIWRSLLRNAEWHPVALPNTMATLHQSDFLPIRYLFTELELLPNHKRFPKNIFVGCGMQTGDAYSSQHLVSSYFGLAYVVLVETNSFPELDVIFPDYAIRTSVGTFSVLLQSKYTLTFKRNVDETIQNCRVKKNVRHVHNLKSEWV